MYRGFAQFHLSKLPNYPALPAENWHNILVVIRVIDVLWGSFTQALGWEVNYRVLFCV